MEEKKKNKIVDRIVEVVLIVIIILLLIHNCELIKKGKKPAPSGNVNIIEITCDDNGKCKKEDKAPNKKDDSESTKDTSEVSGNGYGRNNTTIVVPSESSKDKQNGSQGGQDDSGEDTDDGQFKVYDKNVTWSTSTEVKMFENPVYTIEGKIAPESSNSYQFVVKNSTNYNIRYNISFTEVNPYNINMKYKLKKNGTYVVSDYVSFEQLDLNDLLINSKSSDTFYLDWKWVSSDNDTEAGRVQANYKLSINVDAESV